MEKDFLLTRFSADRLNTLLLMLSMVSIFDDLSEWIFSVEL